MNDAVGSSLDGGATRGGNVDSEMGIGVSGERIKPASEVASDPTHQGPDRRGGPHPLGLVVQILVFPNQIVHPFAKRVEASVDSGGQFRGRDVGGRTAHRRANPAELSEKWVILDSFADGFRLGLQLRHLLGELRRFQAKLLCVHLQGGILFLEDFHVADLRCHADVMESKTDNSKK
jgi:hypothetical protein